MTEPQAKRSACYFCAHKTTRYLRGKGVQWCRRFEVKADVIGCLDFRSTQRVVNDTLDFLKRSAVK